MRGYAVATLLLPLLTAGVPADYLQLPALAPQISTVASSGTIPLQPTALVSQAWNGLELRQAPGVVPDAAPPPEAVAAVAPGAAPLAPGAAPVAAPALPANPGPAPVVVPPVPAPPAAVPAPPLAATATLPLPPLVTGDDFVTTQWVGTQIGTLYTWVPKTITFHFAAMSQAPLPGVGSIGMGTLTGETGRTQTIYMVGKGAAPTAAVDLKKGFVAAVAVGVAGLMV